MFKMKYFIAHRVTGENFDALKVIMEKICNSINQSGNSYYCTFLEEVDSKLKNKFKGMVGIDFYKHAVKELDNSDAIFVFINSESKSEGMLMEVGYAYAKNKKIVVAIKSGVNSYVPGLASKIIKFDNLDSLYEKLEHLK